MATLASQYNNAPPVVDRVSARRELAWGSQPEQERQVIDLQLDRAVQDARDAGVFGRQAWAAAYRSVEIDRRGAQGNPSVALQGARNEVTRRNIVAERSAHSAEFHMGGTLGELDNLANQAHLRGEPLMKIQQEGNRQMALEQQTYRFEADTDKGKVEEQITASDAEEASRKAWNSIERLDSGGANITAARLEYESSETEDAGIKTEYLYDRRQGIETSRPQGITLRHEQAPAIEVPENALTKEQLEQRFADHYNIPVAEVHASLEQQSSEVIIPAEDGEENDVDITEGVDLDEHQGIAADASGLLVDWERTVGQAQARMERNLEEQRAMGYGTEAKPINLSDSYGGAGSDVAQRVHKEALGRTEHQIAEARTEGLVVDEGRALIPAAVAVREHQEQRGVSAASLLNDAELRSRQLEHPISNRDLEITESQAADLEMQMHTRANNALANGSSSDAATLNASADMVETNASMALDDERERLALTAEMYAELVDVNHSQSLRAATNKFAAGVRNGAEVIDLSQEYEVPAGMNESEANRLANGTHESVVSALRPLFPDAEKMGIQIWGGKASIAQAEKVQEQISPGRSISM